MGSQGIIRGAILRSRKPEVLATSGKGEAEARSAAALPRFRNQKPFQVVSPFKPTGDQPGAIEQLSRDLNAGAECVTLLGATGTGKTFTMANVIERTQKPTLIISHNKTLAAQLYEEMKELFPHNSVNYFVSYYDYYQPEAYIPQRDIYIEKDSSRNDELDQLRLAATSSILSRRDTIVVASVSCIFGLGSPLAYGQKVLAITKGSRLGGLGSDESAQGGTGLPTGLSNNGQESGQETGPTRPGQERKLGRREFLLALAGMQYQRSEIEFKRGQYRVRGDAVEIWPAYEKFAVRVELFGDEVDRIELVNPVSGEVLAEEKQFFLFPAVHYVMPEDSLSAITAQIRKDLDERVLALRSEGKLLEAQRLLARTKYDLEMIEEVGFCNGIENYSRYFDGRAPGERPYTLLDYFDFAPPGPAMGEGPTRARTDGAMPQSLAPVSARPNYGDWLVIIDESHVTIPQIHAMFNGDKNRKTILVEHGFRLPAAMDNRPLRFEEFESVVPRLMFVSATPGPYELERSGGVIAEQVIRPTGLLDPTIEVRPAQGQVADLLERCRERAAKGERVLVTALTKRLCEDLTSYLDEKGLRVRYLHSEIETLDRIEILNDLRKGEFDVLVGVNLLREGLDLPEVSLVAVLDADKQGFLRSGTSLIQQMGRAARNSAGYVVMYADQVTPAMKAAIEETDRRRIKQEAYNREHGITPTTIKKAIREGLEAELRARRTAQKAFTAESGFSGEKEYEIAEMLRELEGDMLAAAENLEFEKAAAIRDQVKQLKAMQASGATKAKKGQVEAAARGKGSGPGGDGQKPKERKAGMPGVRASKKSKKRSKPNAEW